MLALASALESDCAWLSSWERRCRASTGGCRETHWHWGPRLHLLSAPSGLPTAAAATVAAAVGGVVLAAPWAGPAAAAVIVSVVLIASGNGGGGVRAMMGSVVIVGAVGMAI